MGDLQFAKSIRQSNLQRQTQRMFIRYILILEILCRIIPKMQEKSISSLFSVKAV